MNKTKIKRYFSVAFDYLFCVAILAIFVFGTYEAFTIDPCTGKSKDKPDCLTTTVISENHKYLIFETEKGTCCTHSANCPCYNKK